MNLSSLGFFIQAWFNLVTTTVCIVVVYRLRGGKIMYPIMLLGAAAFFSFLTNIIGNLEMIWLTTTLEKVVLLVAVIWFAQIFRP